MRLSRGGQLSRHSWTRQRSKLFNTKYAKDAQSTRGDPCPSCILCDLRVENTLGAFHGGNIISGSPQICLEPRPASDYWATLAFHSFSQALRLSSATAEGMSWRLFAT